MINLDLSAIMVLDRFTYVSHDGVLSQRSSFRAGEPGLHFGGRGTHHGDHLLCRLRLWAMT